MASSSINFIQVITSSAFQEGKLEIPNKFVHNHGDNLTDMVELSIPTGGCWEVSVKRDPNGMIWLHGGFLTFMEDTGIKTEYFLMFKHQGDSKFRVSIYDLTATEIIYEAVNEHRMDETNDAGDCSFLYVSSDKSSENGGVDSSENSEDGEVDSSENSEDGGVDPSENFEDGGVDSSEYESGDSSFDFLSCTPGPSEPASKYKENEGTSRGTTRALRGYLTRPKRQRMEGGLVTNGSMGEASAANNRRRKTKQSAAARVENRLPVIPNSFKVHIRPYHMDKCVMRLPSAFARAHMSFPTRDIKLVNANQEWEVCYKHEHNSYMLKHGWYRFAQDKLTEGDICVFERVGSDEDVKLKVNIEAAAIGGRSNVSLPRKMNRSFKVHIRPYHLRRGIARLPSAFARANMSFSRDIMLVDANKKKWKVFYDHQPTSFMLKKGWYSFAKDKRLAEGDVCVFERVGSHECVKLKVNIERKGKQKSLNPSCSRTLLPRLLRLNNSDDSI